VVAGNERCGIIVAAMVRDNTAIARNEGRDDPIIAHSEGRIDG
jgi:hypothetical protein